MVNYYLGALYDAGLLCSGASDPVRYTLKHEAPFPISTSIWMTRPTPAIRSAWAAITTARLRTSTDGYVRWLGDWGVQQPAAVRGFTFGAAPGGGTGDVHSDSLSCRDRQQCGLLPPGERTLPAHPGRRAPSGRQQRRPGGCECDRPGRPHQVTDIVEDSLGSLSIRLNLFGSGRHRPA
ncbi:MAG: hypothetical protein R2838_08365 [Caldilineaceae bacterium]